jgi:hypothetical protein
MADDDIEAERAARNRVERADRPTTSVLPLLVMAFAILTVLVVLMIDKDAPQPGTQPRAENPTSTQPGN